MPFRQEPVSAIGWKGGGGGGPPSSRDSVESSQDC